MMDLSKRINLILEPSVFEMGYEIVQIRIYKNPGMQLQIMAERIDGSGMGVEDCNQSLPGFSTKAITF